MADLGIENTSVNPFQHYLFETMVNMRLPKPSPTLMRATLPDSAQTSMRIGIVTRTQIWHCGQRPFHPLYGLRVAGVEQSVTTLLDECIFGALS
jgi:hypothetical protein